VKFRVIGGAKQFISADTVAAVAWSRPCGSANSGQVSCVETNRYDKAITAGAKPSLLARRANLRSSKVALLSQDSQLAGCSASANSMPAPLLESAYSTASLVYRERPHHGGHIERLIGTKMSKLKSLPGATGGSPKARRSYDPDKHAALTLGELEAWFAQQIVGRYHQEPHRGLNGVTPAGTWALHPAPALPPGPLKRFRIAFLPAISRTLRREGIVFEHLRYWHPIFSQWLVRRERPVLHFDPRNLSKLYVPHEGDYLEVPFSDLRMPAVSLWEVQAATRHLRQAGQKSINPALLIEAIDKQRDIVRAAQAKTRKMRRKQQVAVRPATTGMGSAKRHDCAGTEVRHRLEQASRTV